ncbi:MAG: NAD-dependent DNA ligase LigA, partial [Planctomycetes bacterium]|nr:NAD-dependent DNA ligase LigA [Planctomycetota bacterium]
DLTAIHEIGDKAAQSIVDFFATPENRQTLEDLLAAGVNAAPPERRASGGVLDGKTFVITGTLEGLSRKEAENLIKRHGGKPVSSISKATDYLLCGEKPGSKLTKAEKLGVTVLDVEALQALIESNQN